MVSITQKPRDQRYHKAEAGYVDLALSGECCDECTMYGPGTCDIVEGTINAKGWCYYFDPINPQNRKRHR